MTTITLKYREIPLFYSTLEMMLIQEQIGPISRAVDLMMGKNPDSDDIEDNSKFGGAEHLDTLGKFIVMMGNAGLEEEGKEPDLTQKWVLRALRPKEIIGGIQAVLNAMAEGMQSEIPEEKKTGPVDVTLEEIEKKKQKDG